MGYKKKAIRGVLWITSLRGITRIASFIRLAILGRILTPLEFGFFGIASLLLLFLEIFTETGINVFLVQHKGDIKEYINSAWVVSLLRGVVLFLIIVVTADLISNFFNAPDSISIILLIAFVPLIRGFINPAIVTFQKELLFHREFGLRSILFLVEVFVSIVAVLITKNATSFVWGLIASAMVEVVLSHILIPIRPRLEFEFKKIKHIILRGWWVTLTGIFSYFADNGDNLIVGKILGSSTLGIYQVAYKFSTLPISEVTNVVNQVIFPVYSKFSDDKARVSKAFVKVTALTSIAAIVIGVPIFIFAHPLIQFLMGNQWLDAVPAIRILVIYGIFRTIFGSFSPLFLALGKQDYVAKMTFVRVVGLAIFIVPLVNAYGMVGAGYAMMISVIVEIPVIIFFTLKVFKHKLNNLKSR